MDELTRKIEAHRKIRDMPQPVVAAALGMHVGSYRMRVSGEVDWRIAELRKLSELFGVPLPDLVSDSGVVTLPRLDSNQQPTGSRHDEAVAA